MLTEIRIWLNNTDDPSLRIPLVVMLCVDAFFSHEFFENVKETVYQRITQIEHFRVLSSLKLNLEDYIKNIQTITETFYNHGHFNDNTLHTDISSMTDIQNTEPSVNTVKSSGVDSVEKN